MTEADTLARLREAAKSNAVTSEMLDRAILDARRAGCSLREIAEAADVSHPTVIRVLRYYDTPASAKRDRRRRA